MGRWISEDPIGFAAGDYNVSRYVGNESTTATDPSGMVESVPNSKGAEIAISTLKGIHDKHVGRFYFQVSGFHDLLNTMMGSVGYIKSYSQDVETDGKTAAWLFDIDQLKFRRMPPSPKDIFHEMVHVLDDKNQWYLVRSVRSLEKAERLAFAAESIFDFTNRLHGFHDYMSDKLEDPFEPVAGNAQWHRIWREFVSGYPTWEVNWVEFGIFSVTSKSGKLAWQDLNDVRAKLGLVLSATALTKSANKYLESIGKEPCLTVPPGLPPEIK